MSFLLGLDEALVTDSTVLVCPLTVDSGTSSGGFMLIIYHLPQVSLTLSKYLQYYAPHKYTLFRIKCEGTFFNMIQTEFLFLQIEKNQCPNILGVA